MVSFGRVNTVFRKQTGWLRLGDSSACSSLKLAGSQEEPSQGKGPTLMPGHTSEGPIVESQHLIHRHTPPSTAFRKKQKRAYNGKFRGKAQPQTIRRLDNPHTPA